MSRFFQNQSHKTNRLEHFEAATYVLSYIKFKKEITTHSIGAKIWTLTILTSLVDIMVHCESVILSELCFWIGLVTRLEILALVFTLKQWTNDVSTIYHAIKLGQEKKLIRQGKEIKRIKLFNGQLIQSKESYKKEIIITKLYIKKRS